MVSPATEEDEKMKVTRRTFLKIGGTGLLMAMVPPWAIAQEEFPRPSKKDRCPVCGMFPYKYPYWMTGWVFKDGTKVFFCSPKCFFHALHNVSKYFPGKTRKDIKLLWVTDYYTAEPVRADAPDVYYVVGTSLVGPMGYDVVPVKGREAAEILMRDYEGIAIKRLDEVTEEDIERVRRVKR